MFCVLFYIYFILPTISLRQAWRLKRVSRLFIARTSQAEHTVDHCHEIRPLQYGLEFIMPRCSRIIHSRPWWNVCIINDVYNIHRNVSSSNICRNACKTFSTFEQGLVTHKNKTKSVTDRPWLVPQRCFACNYVKSSYFFTIFQTV